MEDLEEQCACVKFCFKLGKTFTETFQMLWPLWGWKLKAHPACYSWKLWFHCWYMLELSALLIQLYWHFFFCHTILFSVSSYFIGTLLEVVIIILVHVTWDNLSWKQYNYSSKQCTLHTTLHLKQLSWNIQIERQRMSVITESFNFFIKQIESL